MDEPITPQALPGTELNVPAAGSGGADSDTEVVEVKDLMKSVLGKDYPTNEAAIKSLQDTFKFATEQGEKITNLEHDKAELAANQVTPELVKTVEELKTEVKNSSFYAANPDYNNPQAKALIAKFGGNPEDVIKDEVFQTAYRAITSTSAMEQSQSVLHTNPRLGMMQDNMTKATEALKTNDDIAAKNFAVGAVLEAFERKS